MEAAPSFETTSPLEKRFPIRSRRQIQLASLKLDICSNEADFSSLRYFPLGSMQALDGECHYTLNFCNLNVDGPWPLDSLLREQDRTYRARRFAAGYYITDHFGAPAYLLSRGHVIWVFGSNFEQILWPYFVKWLLTVHSMELGMLHLKAASVDVDGAGTLFVGRGGSGKTVLLTRLCQIGARFLSNTHTLVDGETLVAVPAAMRVRPDPLFAPIIASRNLAPGIKPGEYVADPVKDLNWKAASSCTLRNVCLVEYRGKGSHDVREMDRDVLYEYMEQFSLAMNVYGLKEDILDHLGGNISHFATRTGEMRKRLRALIDRIECLHLQCDAMDPSVLRKVWGLLRG